MPTSTRSEHGSPSAVSWAAAVVEDVAPRVLHLVDSGERRGAEVFTADLVRELDRRGVTQWVAVLTGAPPFKVSFAVGSTPLQAGLGIPGLRIDPRAVAMLRRLVNAWDPTAIQTHGGATLKYATPVSGRTPIVARVIGTSAVWATSGPRRLLHARLLRRATHVAAVAEAVRDEAIDTFGISPDRVSTVPNGVDAARLASEHGREATRQVLAIDSLAPVVISVCSLSWEKDPAAHLLVTEEVRRRHPDLVHLIVGDGPLRAPLEAKVRALGRESMVRVLGSRPDIGDLLAASDVLLFASRSDGMEGMPAAVIEAGLAGLPVAGYAVAGVPEVIEDGRTGRLVPPGRPSELARALAGLLEEPDTRAGMGKDARALCLERFTIGSVAERYLEIYRRVGAAGAIPRA